MAQVTIETRTEAEAAKAGNVYQYRALCECGYKSRWSHQWKAEESAENHVCYA